MVFLTWQIAIRSQGGTPQVPEDGQVRRGEREMAGEGLDEIVGG